MKISFWVRWIISAALKHLIDILSKHHLWPLVQDFAKGDNISTLLNKLALMTQNSLDDFVMKKPFRDVIDRVLSTTATGVVIREGYRAFLKAVADTIPPDIVPSEERNG